jgi:hypothetical protein
MRLLILCSSLFLFACHGESKPAATYTQVTTAPDSLVKFRSLDFIVDGKPCSALINQGYKNFKRKKEFPLSLFVTINTVEKDSIGHPTAKEAAIFNALESEILSSLVSETCYVGQTTMDGYRDMIFYIPSKDQKKVSDILENIKKKQARIRSYTFEDDADWEAVSEFYEQL